MIVSSIRTGVVASIAIHVAALAVGPLRVQAPLTNPLAPIAVRLAPLRASPPEQAPAEASVSRPAPHAAPHRRRKAAPVERLASARRAEPARVEATEPSRPSPAQVSPPAQAVPSVVAAAPAAPAPVAITEPVFDAAYLQNPPPAYPPLSRRLHEQGRVLLRVLVSVAGTPDEIELRGSSGYSRLDETARDTVRRWKFVPARRGREPIAAWVLVPISFRLES